MNLFLLNRFRGLLREQNMTDDIRSQEYEKLFGPMGNVFTLVGEYSDGASEDLSVQGSFDEIQEYLADNNQDLFNVFVAVHIKRAIDGMEVDK